MSMGDTAENVKKPGKFSQIKAEFKKVIWPDKQPSARNAQSAVVVVSVCTWCVIAIARFYRFRTEWISLFRCRKR